MKILLFSDSHGYTHNMVKAIDENKDADLVIHLGDYVKDALKLASIYNKMNFEFVAGNNDYYTKAPNEKLLNINDKKIFITHGHSYNVKFGYDKLISKGKAINADMVFFGHTHVNEEIIKEDILLLNPGSISVPVPPNPPTYCIVEIIEGNVSIRFHTK